jgi:hypothetical protein
MKKLALDMDALRVESFDTADVRDGRGTVAGHDGATCTYPCASCVKTCGNPPACTEDLCVDGVAQVTFNACCV